MCKRRKEQCKHSQLQLLQEWQKKSRGAKDYADYAGRLLEVMGLPAEKSAQ